MGNEAASNNEKKEHKHIKSLEEAYAYKAIDNIAQRFP